MEPKGYLTNEKISSKFKSLFDLVNYAIKLAENMIETGRDTRVRTDVQNRSMQILSEIVQGKDVFDDIPEAPEPFSETAGKYTVQGTVDKKRNRTS